MLRSCFIMASALIFINSGLDMECASCIKMVNNARQHFGERISNTTDLQFAEYFVRKCRHNRRKSPTLAAACEEMLQNHPLVLFNDLRNHITTLQTCVDCNLCLTTSTPSTYL
ncbi:hypothetical protein KIN20_005487 [Parelaphostrongylus tenuis]|uniref:Saposin B-type domain-containing protein n=1 Tax=Parelaphostrongylus tenuis TaxID=148309 RepID=A0AAD5MLH6_PARTN|nr:hypothetical protein KIN20_005487 [Parelaphostrongylus tenuis]